MFLRSLMQYSADPSPTLALDLQHKAISLKAALRQQQTEMEQRITEKVLKSDIVSLGKHGISGIIEDQTQRSFLPTPFPEILFAFTAFDQSTDTAALKRDVLEHCFGSSAERVSDYLDTLSACFDPAYMRGERFCGGRPYYLPSHAHELDAAA